MSTRFAVINAGVVENVAIADSAMEPSWVDLTDVDPMPGPGWLYDGTSFSLPPPPPALPPIITKVAMLTKRFTMQEFTGIVVASKTDAEVEAWRVIFEAAATVDLGSQNTQDGMAMLVAKNLLTQARADAILHDPVQPDERP